MKRTPEEAKRARVAYMNHCRAEVEWYRKHGKWHDRIRVTSDGVKFVVGDWSWNRSHPRRKEYVEDAMPRPRTEV